MAPRRTTVCAVLLALLLGAPAIHAQCILANPSFEIGGSGGQVFGGWNQFGRVGSSSDATHGSAAARVSGPNAGVWAVSGYWQEMDTAPGEQWSASVRGWHTAVHPLTGQCRAIVNIEWRDGGGNLIAYESHTVADASTPTGEVQDFTVTSGPAPAGAVATHILLGVLQSPTDPSPDVFYDEAAFDNLGPPSLEDFQWDDFPGGRTVSFGGRTWRVKGPGTYGPGPSWFSDDPGSVWVDGSGRLHLTVRYDTGAWTSSEVALEDALGYGDYVFTTYGRLDDLDPDIVFGLFLWQYGPCYGPAYTWWNPYNEIDIEFSRLGDPTNDPAQFVAQPYDWPGNLDRFDASFSKGELTSHAFRWLHDRVEFRSWRGGPGDESPGSLIHSWTYTGPHIPRPEFPRVHLNLWQLGGKPPASDQEVVLDAFTFVPEGSVPVSAPEAFPLPHVTRLLAPHPNPFRARTAIDYVVEEEGEVEISVYDLSGRRVRTLVAGVVAAGAHETAWDGRDESGRRAAAGVYLTRLRAGTTVEARRTLLLR